MRLSTYVIGVPVAVAAAVVAVANREIVRISLDPFDRDNPALSIHMPLFLMLFLVFAAGILLGWLVAVWTRSRSGKSRLPAVKGGDKPPSA